MHSAHGLAPPLPIPYPEAAQAAQTLETFSWREAGAGAAGDLRHRAMAEDAWPFLGSLLFSLQQGSPTLFWAAPTLF